MSIPLFYIVKNPIDFTVKQWQLASSVFTVNFTGASRMVVGWGMNGYA